MRGIFAERLPGRRAIVLDTHDAVTGKRKRKWHSFSRRFLNSKFDACGFEGPEGDGHRRGSSCAESSRHRMACGARWTCRDAPRLTSKTVGIFVGKNIFLVPFESFRSKLKAALIKGELRTSDATRKSLAGRKP